jgi:hypothetical protein
MERGNEVPFSPPSLYTQRLLAANPPEWKVIYVLFEYLPPGRCGTTLGSHPLLFNTKNRDITLFDGSSLQHPNLEEIKVLAAALTHVGDARKLEVRALDPTIFSNVSASKAFL